MRNHDFLILNDGCFRHNYFRGVLMISSDFKLKGTDSGVIISKEDKSFEIYRVIDGDIWFVASVYHGYKYEF